MKSGFSLLELVLALFMASLVSLSLFQLLTNVSKSVKRITNVIEVDLPSMAFYNQVEKDVLAMFTPRSSLMMYAEKEEKEQAEKKQKLAEKALKQEEKKQKIKGITPVFSMEGKKDSFFWSFITSGAIAMLDADGSLLPMPSTRRVAYVLVPDPARPGTMRLMYRFSSKELSAEALKKSDFSPSYELVSGIKNLEIEVTLIEFAQKEEQDKKGAGEGSPKDEKKGTTVVIKEWREEEMWQKYKSLIPAYIKLKGTIADPAGIEYPFEFLFKVIAYNPWTPKKAKKEKDQEQNIFKKLEEIAGRVFKP